MSPGAPARRLLLVGGGGGLVGRSALSEFLPRYRIRSVHRHAVAPESVPNVEWLPADIATVSDWRPILDGVDLVVNLAWYRAGGRRRFEPLYEGLARLLTEARRAGIPRFLHVSVPDGPERLERRLPYFTFKRRFDRDLASSGLSYAIVRPTMMFARRDKLLGVMLRLMHRYPWFPMFGDGQYRLSPVAASDVTRLLGVLANDPWTGTVDVGGPVAYRYRELTDLMWRSLGKTPSYVHVGGWGARTVARLLESVGSSLLYEYEVEWLMADLLGLPPCPRIDWSMQHVEPYLEEEAARLRQSRIRP